MNETAAAPQKWTVEVVWTVYLLVVGVIVAVWGLDAPGGPGRALTLLGAHAGVLLVVWTAVLCRTPRALRIHRTLTALGGLLVAFTVLGFALPDVHPEPYEWSWIALDRGLFGIDITVAGQALAAPWFVELLQWCYASFYFWPLSVALLTWVYRGGAAFDQALGAVVLGFLISYYGYLLWPTLPPYRFLDHGEPLQGVWLQAEIYAMLDEGEFNRWNCFPSGHTMMSVVAAVLAWRNLRPMCWIVFPVVALIVLSTIVLRYHYVVDVVAGLALVPMTFWIADRLFGRWSAPALQAASFSP